jgi:hypothetical protein
MSRQDANAGNVGDQLKHALLIETIQRLPADPAWAYAETHAGAGAYESDQARILIAAARRAAAGRAAARRVAANSGVPGRGPDARTTGHPVAGTGYAAALLAREAGWPAEERDRWYPGSVLLAVGGRAQWSSVRLAEADPAVMDRLATHMTIQALRNSRFSSRGELAGQPRGSGLTAGLQPPVELYPGSFELHLDELMREGPLFLLVDPYYYQSAASQGEGGCLGLRHLDRIIQAVSGRDAVLMLFTSSAPGDGCPDSAEDPPILMQQPWQALCADLTCMAGRSVRCFRAAGAAHAVCLAGWGRGAAVVDDLPGDQDWRASWLADPPLGLSIVEEALAPSRRR